MLDWRRRVRGKFRLAGIAASSAPGINPAVCRVDAGVMAWMDGMMGILGLLWIGGWGRVAMSGCRVGASGSGGRVRWGWIGLGLDCSLPGFAVADQPYGRRFCALLFTRLDFRPGTGRYVWRLGRTRLLRLV